MAISMNFNEALDSTKLDNISFINWVSSQKVIPNINIPRYCASCGNLMKIEYNDNYSDGAMYRCTSRNCRNIQGGKKYYLGQKYYLTFLLIFF